MTKFDLFQLNHDGNISHISSLFCNQSCCKLSFVVCIFKRHKSEKMGEVGEQIRYWRFCFENVTWHFCIFIFINAILIFWLSSLRSFLPQPWSGIWARPSDQVLRGSFVCMLFYLWCYFLIDIIDFHCCEYLFKFCDLISITITMIL